MQRPKPGSLVTRRVDVQVRTAALDLEVFRGPCDPAGGKVHDIFDTKGTSLFENPGRVHYSARQYRMCAAWRTATGNSKVQIQYNNYATHGGPQHVVYKKHY